MFFFFCFFFVAKRSPDYEVEFYTGNEEEASTEAQVYVQLFGTKGISKALRIPKK